MGQDIYSDESDAGRPAAYWRRRVIAMCAGLILLALLAWAFSGGGKATGTAQKGSPTSSARPAVAYSGSSASPASGTGGSAAASSAPAGSAAILPFPTMTSGSSGTPTRKAAVAPGGGTGVEPGGGCAPGSVVLSLFTSRTSYYAGQYPAFQVDAVSTASRTCSFDLSPRRLHVQVTSSGRVIWDSADCSNGEPNRAVQLRRGVPTEASVTWHRIISLPGCVTVASLARPGTYQVQAKDASVTSPVRSFKLVR